jgi:hypothetical protein
MVFWSTTTASLKWIDTWRKQPARFLRLTSATEGTKPKGFEGLKPPSRLMPQDVGLVAAFWTQHYGGTDWYLDAQPGWVSAYLEDPVVVVLGLKGFSGELIATIVSTPLTRGSTQTSNGGLLYTGTMRVIEGLCIAKQYRDKGLAGYMIAAMDAYTSATRPVAHLWSRETAVAPMFSTALRTDTYALMRTKKATVRLNVERCPWDHFVKQWQRSCIQWLLKDGLEKPECIVTTTPLKRSDHVDVWIQAESRKIVVVVHTRRRSLPEDEPILEVAWCGYLENGTLRPNIGGRGFRPVIESVGAQYANALLFASSGYMGGEACAEWAHGGLWRYGKSGVHNTYLYNYVAPSYGSTEVYAIREEI